MIKKKWTWIIIVFFILFISGSSYRYYIVNRSFSNYKVQSSHIEPGDTFNLLELEHKLGEPTKVETTDEMKNKVTEYHIPAYFKNIKNTTINLQPEFYSMVRGDRQIQTIDFINNDTKKRIKGFRPNEEIKGEIIFSYIEIPGKENEKKLPAYLHIIGSDGKSVQKFDMKAN